MNDVRCTARDAKGRRCPRAYTVECPHGKFCDEDNAAHLDALLAATTFDEPRGGDEYDIVYPDGTRTHHAGGK